MVQFVDLRKSYAQTVFTLWTSNVRQQGKKLPKDWMNRSVAGATRQYFLPLSSLPTPTIPAGLVHPIISVGQTQRVPRSESRMFRLVHSPVAHA